MHTLFELKQMFENKQITIKEYNGWKLILGNGDDWGLAFDEYMVNNQVVTRKEIPQYIKNYEEPVEEKKAKTKTKKRTKK